MCKDCAQIRVALHKSVRRMIGMEAASWAHWPLAIDMQHFQADQVQKLLGRLHTHQWLSFIYSFLYPGSPASFEHDLFGHLHERGVKWFPRLCKWASLKLEPHPQRRCADFHVQVDGAGRCLCRSGGGLLALCTSAALWRIWKHTGWCHVLFNQSFDSPHILRATWSLWAKHLEVTEAPERPVSITAAASLTLWCDIFQSLIWKSIFLRWYFNIGIEVSTLFGLCCFFVRF